MKRIWVVGGGFFGQRAVQTLARKWPNADIVLIDPDDRAGTICRQFPCRFICCDGVSFLLENLPGVEEPDWIVPAAPVHLAYEWIRGRLAADFTVEDLPVPAETQAELPNVMPGKEGQVYTSVADFICPPDCPAPPKRCTYTGKPRPMDICRVVQRLTTPGYLSVVVQSRQLAPGVGGYRPERLLDAFERIASMNTPVLLTTACTCHGVMNAFYMGKP